MNQAVFNNAWVGHVHVVTKRIENQRDPTNRPSVRPLLRGEQRDTGGRPGCHVSWWPPGGAAGTARRPLGEHGDPALRT